MVVAPHEFFFLGAGVLLRGPKRIPNLVVFNTEQMDSQWFLLAEESFPKARAVWDVDRQTCDYLRDRGHKATHLPLGYEPSCRLFEPVIELPRTRATAHLGPEVLRSRPFEDRPLDVLFLGSLAQRRELFFGSAGRLLSKHRCFIHFSDASQPVRPGKNADIDTRVSLGLAQRAKIVLNLHRFQARYFEWHRAAVHGIGQRALVLSEPCTDPSPFQAGRDFIEASLEELPRRIEELLSRDRWRETAERGFLTYSQECRMSEVLRPLLRELRSPSPKVRTVVAVSTKAGSSPVRAVFQGGSGRGKPFVTVAVTLYNYEKYIRECLDSVREQTLGRLDLIVLDDCSTDGSLAACASWLKRHAKRFNRALLLRHRRNAGLACSRNRCVSRARTPYVFILDADNLIYPSCLSKLLSGLENSGADLAYASYSKIGEEQGLKNVKPWGKADFRNGNYVDAMALLRKKAWRRLGGYRKQSVQGWEDFDFYVRLAKAGGWGVFVPEVLGAYRVHLRSMLHRETNLQAWRLQDLFCDKHGLEFLQVKPPKMELALLMYGVTRPPERLRRRPSWRRTAALEMLQGMGNGKS